LQERINEVQKEIKKNDFDLNKLTRIIGSATDDRDSINHEKSQLRNKEVQLRQEKELLLKEKIQIRELYNAFTLANLQASVTQGDIF
jgi:predicted  nucleic acid-binding Zn-ribbon protein